MNVSGMVLLGRNCKHLGGGLVKEHGDGTTTGSFSTTVFASRGDVPKSWRRKRNSRKKLPVFGKGAPTRGVIINLNATSGGREV